MAMRIKRIFKRRRLFRTQRQKEAFEFYVGISPWLIGFLFFTGGPVIASFLISFTDWKIIGTPEWVGLANYYKIFMGDKTVGVSLWNTFFYTVLSVPLGLIGSLLVALLLNQKVPGTNLFRTLFYLPAVTSGVAIALLWVWILHPEFGLVNLALSMIGIEGPAWLFDPSWSKPALVLMSMWGVGYNAVIFLAALQGMPQHLYDAAKIDGANQLEEFWHVTLPMLTPTVFFLLVVSIIGSFQIFTNVYILTNGKGGPGQSTLMFGLYLYKNAFEYFKMGYAAGLAWVLFLIVMVLTLVQMLGAKRWVYYEAEVKGGKV